MTSSDPYMDAVMDQAAVWDARLQERPVTSSDPYMDAVMDQAAVWDARLRSPQCSANDREVFQAWYDAAVAHAAVFDELQGAFAALRASAERPELRVLREQTAAKSDAVRGRRFLYGIAAAAAAAVAVIVITSIPLSKLGLRPSGTPETITGLDIAAALSGGHVYRTALNERSAVRLEDGSTVILNSESVIETRFEPARRNLKLLKGEALFRVAKDPTRPFVVEAAGRTVTALGTVFDVRLDPDRVEVTLLEGRVAVKPAKNKAISELTPQQQLTDTGTTSNPTVRVVDADTVMSWTDGHVFFEDEALSKAVSEMNRYSANKIVIADPTIGNYRVNGMFRVGNQSGFAAALADYFPISVEAGHDGEILLHERK